MTKEIIWKERKHCFEWLLRWIGASLLVGAFEAYQQDLSQFRNCISKSEIELKNLYKI